MPAARSCSASAASSMPRPSRLCSCTTIVTAAPEARTSCKDQVHAVLAKCGITVSRSDIFGPGGGIWLDGLVLSQPYAGTVASLRAPTAVLDAEIARLEQQAAAMLAGDPGYAAMRRLPGIGPVLGAVICAEIGDITRFGKPGQLASWAGLTPRH